jgi:uncharacterized membrane protein
VAFFPSPQEAITMADLTPITPSNRVWPFPAHQRREPVQEVNVGDTERVLSVIGGTALALWGLSRGSLAGLGLVALGGALVSRGAAGHCNVHGALGIGTAEPRGRLTTIPAGRGVKVETSISIDRSQEDLFRLWRNIENLPRIMSHLESVRTSGPNTSHWVARGPLGTSFEWDAELYRERPNELIAWRSLPGSEVDTAGSVHFTPAPGGRGVEVKVVLKYDPPAGKAGAAVASLLGNSPEAMIEADLRRYKALMETGD